MSGGAINLPPDELRCTAIVESTGERCRAWAARKHGLDVCSGHAKLSTGRARKAKSDKAAERHESEARDVLARIEARVVAAEHKVEQTDPFEPVSFAQAVTERDRARAEEEKAKASLAARQAALLEPPERTPEMEAQSLWWVRRHIHPAHPAPPGAIRDPISGLWFTWVTADVRPPSGPKNLLPTDPDVQRIVNERAADRQPYVDPEVSRRISECQSNGYALAHYAGQAGMDPEEYLDSLFRQQADAWGHDVDLNDESAPEYQDVIAPELARVARRRAWHRVGVIK